MSAHQANLAIFRIPDEDGKKTFVEVTFENGVLQDTAAVFVIPEGDTDSYHDMEFYHVVIASLSDDGEVVTDLARYEVTDENDETMEAVHESEDLAEIITTIFEAYVANHPTLH